MFEKMRLWFCHNLWGSYFVVLFLAGIVYFATCAPAVLWQDSGLYAYRIWHNNIEGNFGLALSHSLHEIIGVAVKYLIPVGDLAHRLNLISSVFGAIAVANLFLLLRLWLNRSFGALVGAMSLMLAWTFWQYSVIVEVYTLFAALLFAELIMVLMYLRTKRAKYLYFLAILNGLSFANHMLACFAFVCYVVFLLVLVFRKQLYLKSFLLMAVVWLVFASPYEYFIVKRLIETGDLMGTLASMAFGDLWKSQVLNLSITPKIVFENMMFIGMNFPTPNFLLFFVGCFCLWKKAPTKSFANIVFVILLLYFVFAFRYTIPYRFAFFIPFYCIAALLIGVGADTLLQRYNRKALAICVLLLMLLPIPTYFAAPSIGRKMYKSLGQRRQRPYRDEYEFFLKPWKTGYRGAERFGIEALETVEPGAVLYAYTTEVHAVLYAQEVLGFGKDVKVVSDYDKGANASFLSVENEADIVSGPGLYVVSPVAGYCPAYLLDKYDFVKEGIIYKVIEKPEEKQTDSIE